MELVHGLSYVIAGGRERLPALLSALETSGMTRANNPDIYVREYAQFKVDDARELRERAELRAVDGGGRVFVIISATMNPQAQNALLKTIEEPRAGASFFFLVPSPMTLLPTLRSRLQTVSIETGNELEEAERFLAAPPAERIELLKPVYTHDEDEERDVRRAVELLAGIERVLATRLTDQSAREGLAAVYRARRYVTDTGALLKPLLEQVALLAPRV